MICGCQLKTIRRDPYCHVHGRELGITLESRHDEAVGRPETMDTAC